MVKEMMRRTKLRDLSGGSRNFERGIQPKALAEEIRTVVT